MKSSGRPPRSPPRDHLRCGHEQHPIGDVRDRRNRIDFARAPLIAVQSPAGASTHASPSTTYPARTHRTRRPVAASRSSFRRRIRRARRNRHGHTPPSVPASPDAPPSPAPPSPPSPPVPAPPSRAFTLLRPSFALARDAGATCVAACARTARAATAAPAPLAPPPPVPLSEGRSMRRRRRLRRAASMPVLPGEMDVKSHGIVRIAASSRQQ